MCDSLESAEVESLEHRVARRAHRCDACREEIRPGDTYARTGVLFDGSWSTVKHCARCHALFVALCSRTRGPVPFDLDCGEVWDNPPPELAALAFWVPGDGAPEAAR